MLKVFKSEMLKYFSGKMVHICSLILLVMPAFLYGVLSLVVIMSPPGAEDVVAQMTNVSAQGYMLQTLLELYSGGTLLIVAIVLATSLITEDYSNGTMKYALLAVSKKDLILGKVLTAAAICLIYTLAIFIGSGVVGVLAYGWNGVSYNLLQVTGGYLLGWLATVGFTTLIMFAVRNITKTSGAIGLGFGIYFVMSICGQLLPASINGIFINANILNIMAMSTGAWLKVLIGAIAYIVIFTLWLMAGFKKKEILA